MKDLDFTIYEVNSSEMPLDIPAKRTGGSPRLRTTGGVRHSCDAAGYSISGKRAAWQVGEERSFYIPDVVSEEGFRANPEYFSAAFGYARDLSKAKRLLRQALDLVRPMSAKLCDEGDCRAMEDATAYAVIEKKLSKAYDRINKHDRCHTNLFLAYFDLKGRTDGAAE